jgi:hypothetical protein
MPCGALWGCPLCPAGCLRANEKAPRLRSFFTKDEYMNKQKPKI